MTAIRKILSTRKGTLGLACVAAVVAGVALLIFVNSYKRTLDANAEPVTVLVARDALPKGSSGDLIAKKGLFEATGHALDTAYGVTDRRRTLVSRLLALGFALGPLFSRVPFEWQTIGSPSDFTKDNYVTKVLTVVPGVGEVGKTIAYVRARNPAIVIACAVMLPLSVR